MRPRDTFNASKLVLDLDAADSKYVRRYEELREQNEARDNAEASKRCRKRIPQRKEVVSHMLKATLPEIYKATEWDYLAFALLGRPRKFPSSVNRSLHYVLSKNMVYPKLASFEANIQWLKDNAAIAAEPSPTVPDHYEAHLLQCQRLFELRRTTETIAKKPQGCKYLSTNGKIIVKAIRQARCTEQCTPSAVLKYINALAQRLSTTNYLEPDTPLCEAALYYAAKISNYPAMKTYIDHLSAKSDPVGPHRVKALGIAVMRLEHPWISSTSPMNGSQNPTLIDEHRRAAVLRLLTGWERGGVPSFSGEEVHRQEEREASFATLIHGDATMYATYITSLGKVGARDALWYEWRNQEVMPEPVSPANLSSEGTGNGKVNQPIDRSAIFLEAFLLAGDPRRAFQVFCISEVPCDQKPDLSDNSLCQFREVLLSHYRRHGLSDVEVAERLGGDLAGAGFAIGDGLHNDNV